MPCNEIGKFVTAQMADKHARLVGLVLRALQGSLEANGTLRWGFWHPQCCPQCAQHSSSSHAHCPEAAQISILRSTLSGLVHPHRARVPSQG
jgi:hypothetical protein